MRSPLFWKLFTVQLLAAAALLVGALAVMRLQTAHSFGAYVSERERQRLHELGAQFAGLYLDQHRDLQRAAWAMASVLGDRDDEPGPAEERGPPGERFGPPRDRPPPPPPRGPQQPPPIRLQDPDGRFLAGSRVAPREDWWREAVEVDGVRVAEIVRPPVRVGLNPDEAGFAQRQLRGLLVVGGIALVLAALSAALLSSLMLRPICSLQAGAARLAGRDFAARLPVLGADELGRLAEDFNRLAEALERFDARQRQWLADIAHELRTPLAVLRGELEALQDGVRQADAGSLRSLHQEVLRLGALVDDLHLLSSAEAGGLSLHREVVDAAALAQDAAQRLASRFAQAGFTLQVQAGAGRVFADVQRIEQVLANLLENALRHAAPGKVTLAVAARGPVVEFTLTDSGPGVPAEALPRLFDRLFRVDAARSRRHGGAGLGLAICRSIVEAHGGRIAARHASGGLEIAFTLPAPAS